MASIKNINPGDIRPGAYKGRYMIDTYRGKLRVRKWPKKRGKNLHPKTLKQMEWFKRANTATKFIAPSEQMVAMWAAKGTGLYPRDLLMSALAGGLFDIETVDGETITRASTEVQPVTFQGARMERSANFGFPASTWTAIPWDNPVLNPNAMWNISAPTRLTVPAGVNVVAFQGGFITSTQTTATIFIRVRKNGTTTVAQTVEHRQNTKLGVIVSGPVNVLPGDWFELQIHSGAGETLNGGPRNYFGAHIIGAA